jgi:hypothetical protein
MIHRKNSTLGIDNSIFLLISIVAFVLIFPVIDNKMIHDFFVALSYTLVLLSIFSIVEKKSKILIYMIYIAVTANILMFFAKTNAVELVTFSISIITFTIATVVLIKHVATNKNVTSAVIIQAICGYLLIGIIGVLLNGILLGFNENAISFPEVGNKFSSIVYYSFITLTTIGYGEIIPQSVLARSISILIGASGQIYLTVVIALIVGKFLVGKFEK